MGATWPTSMARRRGLTAQFQVVANSLSEVKLRPEPNSCLVYDTDRFSFAQIVSDMEQRAAEHLSVGTYSCKSKVIITPSEIIR